MGRQERIMGCQGVSRGAVVCQAVDVGVKR